MRSIFLKRSREYGGNQKRATAHSFKRKLGNTTYTVKVHFSKDTAETFKDRVQKLIINVRLEKIRNNPRQHLTTLIRSRDAFLEIWHIDVSADNSILDAFNKALDIIDGLHIIVIRCQKWESGAKGIYFLEKTDDEFNRKNK